MLWAPCSRLREHAQGGTWALQTTVSAAALSTGQASRTAICRLFACTVYPAYIKRLRRLAIMQARPGQGLS
jgi:hypothetical protein